MVADRFVLCRSESGVLDEENVDFSVTHIPSYVVCFFFCELVAVPCRYFEVAFCFGLKQQLVSRPPGRRDVVVECHLIGEVQLG